MAFTYVNSIGGSSGGSSTTVAATLVGPTVAAGDLIVVVVKWEGATTTCSVSDGTTTLTEWSKGVQSQSGNEPFMDVFYLLASVATGLPTYTATLGAARSFKDISVMVYRPPSAASLDGTPNANSNAGSSTLDTGNIT